jgi:dienelactone hydrolase
MRLASVARRAQLGHPWCLVGPQRWLIGPALLAAAWLAGCTQHAGMPAQVAPEKPAIREEAVAFVSGKFTLAGTVFLPEGTQPHPAVVLFHGSGPQSRDLSTAHWFAEQGVAALAYDKRGVGESTGDFRAVPFMDLCDDGLAAINYLKSRPEVDPKRIGVWGLSQGGWLGPLAASRSADVAFVIAVSGPGVSPGEQMIVYYENELRREGLRESDVREASSLRREIWTYMETGENYEKTKADLEQARTKSWFAKAKVQQDDSFGPLPAPEERTKPSGRSLLWFGQEAVYDPVPALRDLHVPALFLFGDQDQLIPVAKSIEIIRFVQGQDPHHNFTIREFPNADHGMYSMADGGPQLDPEYLKTMHDWLRSNVLQAP